MDKQVLGVSTRTLGIGGNMRAYFFGNMYLSSIQQGIQAQHCTAEMFVKYQAGHPEKYHDQLYDWAQNHKTSVLLNGGDCAGLSEIFQVLDSPDNPYPWAVFLESNDALRNALTCVGIVIPKRVYVAAELTRKVRRKGWGGYLGEYTEWESKLIDVMNRCGLAR